jgi:hypothetical protein
LTCRSEAYRRSDALENRRKLMEAWAAYCEPKNTSNVVPIRNRSHIERFGAFYR